MERLKEIIGPAPSELTQEGLARVVEREQRRTASMLQVFREKPPVSPRGKKRKKPKAATNKDLREAAEELGLSVEEFISLAKEQKEREKENGT